MYNIQIWQDNIRHINIIAMKDIIKVAKKNRKNQEPLAEKFNKAAIIKIAKVLKAIDMNSKYKQAINNTDINAARDLRLTSIKKY